MVGNFRHRLVRSICYIVSIYTVITASVQERTSVRFFQPRISTSKSVTFKGQSWVLNNWWGVCLLVVVTSCWLVGRFFFVAVC